MPIRRLISRPIALAVSLVAAAGCGSQTLSPANPADVASLARFSNDPNGSATYVYTCQNAGSNPDCLAYQKNKIVRTLKETGSPQGVAAGKDGIFYVADASAKGVLVYAAGGKKLLSRLDDGGNVPLDVAVYNDTLAVSNQKNLTFFAKGATKPTRTLKDSSVLQGSGAAFDSAGNCYWSFSTQGSGARVDEFTGCKGKAHQLNIAAGSPYGIAFDGNGNLYYTSYSSSADGVYKCKGVKSCALAYNQFVNPQYLNFSQDYADLWIDDTANYQTPAALYEIDVARKKVVDKIYQGISFFDPPSGIAAGPGPL